MKTATVREVRQNFGKLLAWIEAGEEVSVTMHRKMVARIVPPLSEKPRKPDWAAFVARQKKALVGKKPLKGNSVLLEREGHQW
jgi:antitoxin (DNA-binding transcriptional repressor) of toxin-antitoxin stability system